jgi:hypothetical protein
MFRVLSRILVALGILSLTGCLSIQNRYGEECKSRTYLRNPVEDHLSTEYSNNPMARLGIVPFVAPANFAGAGDSQPPLGSQLAWRLHAEILRLNKIPIVEVTTWTDWPLKREDFFSGNFEAMQRARDAGYDMIFVGYLEESNPEEVAVLGKLIDVNVGKTLWYGRALAFSRRNKISDLKHHFGATLDHSLSSLDLYPLYSKLVQCLAEEALSDDMDIDEKDSSTPWWKGWLRVIAS